PAPHEPVTRLPLDTDVMFEAQCREEHQKRDGESGRAVLLERGPCRKERLGVNCTGEMASRGDDEELECNDLYQQPLEPADHHRGRGVTQRRGVDSHSALNARRRKIYRHTRASTWIRDPQTEMFVIVMCNDISKV